ncbi:MAG: aminopeptidase [Anaerolineales bacterium]|jgi:aminopeptidase|nr:aminopeptidase [Anaerolineales bacterium]
MADPRIENFARILVEYSTDIQPGDRVIIEASTEALPLVEEVFKKVILRGGRPHLQLEFPEQRALFLQLASPELLSMQNEFVALAYREFEARIRLWSEANTRALSNVDPAKQSAAAAAFSPSLKNQFERSAAGQFKWVTSIYPTQGYAMQAGMSLSEYTDFVLRSVHAHEADPVAHWLKIKEQQQYYMDALAGHDRVQLRGPNVDLTLSIKDRTWKNSYGRYNMPDGEIYTGPVEDSLNGWVRYTYPAMEGGVVVEGAELHFKDGKVVQATARSQEAHLKQMLATDPGASYVGEFAIGLNKDIDRFTGHILLDEKIGGSFHMALGMGYPETGNTNVSAIHWDMICDLRTDSEIHVDGELFYKNGEFVI